MGSGVLPAGWIILHAVTAGVVSKLAVIALRAADSRQREASDIAVSGSHVVEDSGKNYFFASRVPAQALPDAERI